MKFNCNCKFQILPYVNGSLHTLLSETLFVQEAQQIGLEVIINEKIVLFDHSIDQESKRQLEYIIDQITYSKSDKNDDNRSSVSDDESDEQESLVEIFSATTVLK